MAGKLTVAIFGIGRMGQVHLRHLAYDDRADVKYLVDVPDTHQMIRSLVAKYRLSGTRVVTPDSIDDVVNDQK